MQCWPLRSPLSPAQLSIPTILFLKLGFVQGHGYDKRAGGQAQANHRHLGDSGQCLPNLLRLRGVARARALLEVVACPGQNVAEKKSLEHAKLELLEEFVTYFSTAASITADVVKALDNRQRDIVQMQKMAVKLEKPQKEHPESSLSIDDVESLKAWRDKALSKCFLAVRSHVKSFKKDVRQVLDARLQQVLDSNAKVCKGGLEEGSSWKQPLPEAPSVQDLIAAAHTAKLDDKARSKKMSADFKDLCQEHRWGPHVHEESLN